MINRIPLRTSRENLRLYAIPITVTVISAIAVLVAIVLLTLTVRQQIETGTELLGINLSDQTRTFVQLQRETLRMLVKVEQPINEFEVEEARTQYAILESRVNHMNRAAVEAVVPPLIAQNAVDLDAMWDDISVNIEQWLLDSENDDLRDTVSSQLVEFERLANITEIEFNRSRTLTLTNFAQTSREIPVAFGIVTMAMVAVLLAVLFGVYRYIRQVHQAEAAQQASQQKDQFLAVMSHELRTPLNAIIGFLGIIKMSAEIPEKQMHMVERSRANAERLLLLIDDILDITKMESGRFEIHLEDVAPRDLFARWQSQNEILAAQKNLAFTVDVDASLPQRISADADVLTKIVTNLLSNAFKFTEKGAVNLRTYATKDNWMIEVHDTGIGIPVDKYETVFESFRQVDGSIRRAYGGTGLGLSIVKQLAQLLNGDVVLQSELGKGSHFTVTLPLILPHEVPEELTNRLPIDANVTQETENAYSR